MHEWFTLTRKDQIHQIYKYGITSSRKIGINNILKPKIKSLILPWINEEITHGGYSVRQTGRDSNNRGINQSVCLPRLVEILTVYSSLTPLCPQLADQELYEPIFGNALKNYCHLQYLGTTTEEIVYLVSDPDMLSPPFAKTCLKRLRILLGLMPGKTRSSLTILTMLKRAKVGPVLTSYCLKRTNKSLAIEIWASLRYYANVVPNKCGKTFKKITGTGIRLEE